MYISCHLNGKFDAWSKPVWVRCTCRRDCVGQTLAKTSVLSTIAGLMARFHFRLAEDIVGPPSQVEQDQINSVTVTPGKGMWMHAEPRWL
jgi:hypothetical protein